MNWEARVNGSRIWVRASVDGDGRCIGLDVEARPYGQPLPSVLSQTFTAVSIGLKGGVPLWRFARTLGSRRDETAGVVEGDAFVTEAASIVDYVFKSCIARGLK